MIARTRRRMDNLTYGDGPSDKVRTWSSIPNASVGKDIEKSIGQAIRDGGVKGVRQVNRPDKKFTGQEITTKKGNKTTVKDLIHVDRPDKNKGFRKNR